MKIEVWNLLLKNYMKSEVQQINSNKQNSERLNTERFCKILIKKIVNL